MTDGKDEEYKIPTIVLNIIIIIINFYLIFIFFKSKSFKEYSLYNIIIFSFILLIDNILRLIDLTDKDEEKHTKTEKVQAFVLAFFDKLILANLTMHTLIFYLGLVKSDTYYAHELIIYVSCFILNFTICSILVGIYIGLNDVHQPHGRYYCYVDDSDTKKVLDTIFNTLYYSINLFCTINLFMFISGKMKEAKFGIIPNYEVYKRTFKKIIFSFFITFVTFLESYLIIYEVLEGPKTDLIYLITCIIIDFYISTNKTIINETLKLFCKNIYEKYNKERTKSNKYLDNEDMINKGLVDDDDEEEINNNKNAIEIENRRTSF